MKRTRIIGIFTLLCCLFSWFSLSASANEPIRIGFLDSGVSTKHLYAAQILNGENFVFPQDDTDDRTGHGTETVGIVLGSSDGTVSGICPDALIVPLVCSDRYPSGTAKRTTPQGVADAIYAAVDTYACRVINISLGFPTDNAALREAVQYAAEKDVLIVASVGNENESDPEKAYYPASYDSVLGVGCAENGKVASFSQRHGVDIVTDSRFYTVGNKNSASRVLRVGTSYACAYISGLCARLRARYPDYSAEDIKNFLYEAAQDIENIGFDSDSGHGYLPSFFPVFSQADERSNLFLRRRQTPFDMAANDIRQKHGFSGDKHDWAADILQTIVTPDIYRDKSVAAVLP